eukprot:SAG11_NODE_1279_length_5314_cov_3.403835_4_plen_144_part_00
MVTDTSHMMMAYPLASFCCSCFALMVRVELSSSPPSTNPFPPSARSETIHSFLRVQRLAEEGVASARSIVQHSYTAQERAHWRRYVLRRAESLRWATPDAVRRGALVERRQGSKAVQLVPPRFWVRQTRTPKNHTLLPVQLHT